MAKIMLVDDESDIIFTTKLILERGGYEVVVAKSGKECLDNIMEEKPDLVLLDIMMGALDGWEVGKKIKEDKETNHIPVVMFTVRTSAGSKIKSFQYSKADAHIDKPFHKEELLGTIKRVLKSSKDVK